MASTDKQLLAAIERAETLAEDGKVVEERINALRLYRGDNTNPAEEGRSQYVARDAYDVVETIKPQLLKLFLSGDQVVRFDPAGPEDVEQAALETEYINYVALQRNDAFSVLDGWIHDGLVQKNGYVWPQWDESETVDRESYEGLSEDELALLLADDSIEIESQSVDERGYSLTIKRTSKTGRVRIVNIAPENVRVSHTHTGVCLAECDFVQVRLKKTLSELRASGFDVPDDLTDGGDDDSEEQIRREGRYEEDEGADPAMREVLVRYNWIRTALEAGGKQAELRFVVVVGKRILRNKPSDLIELIAWSPKALPHQHVGMSSVDETADIQGVKTAMTRGALDNVYLSLNGRHAIDTDRVNLDDMLVSRPGGVVRVQGDPASAIMPLTSVPTQSIALQAIEYFDQVRESRTGITRYTSGLDPNSLNKTYGGIMQLQAASMQRIELIGRRLAEAVKVLFLTVHALTLKHGRKAEMVRLSNKWVTVDPSSWKRRMDVTISVGLGTGNRQEQSMFLMQMLQLALGPGLQMGLTDPSKLYAMLARLTNNAGFKSVEEFWSDPSGQPPKQQPPDPRLLIEQAKLQQAQAETQIEAQQGQAKLQAEMQIEQMKLAAESQLERERIASQERIAAAKLAADERNERRRLIVSRNQSLASRLRSTKVRNERRI